MKVAVNDRRTSASAPASVDTSVVSDIIGYRLRVAQIAVFADFQQTFRCLNIKPVQYTLLRLIETNPDIRQGQLAETLGIKRANMVGLVHKLVDRGFVERRPVAGDRRSNALHLTPTGRTFVKKMQKVWTHHESRLVEQLGGAAEKKKLVRLLQRLATDFPANPSSARNR